MLTPLDITSQFYEEDSTDEYTVDNASIYYTNEISKVFKPSLEEKKMFIEFIKSKITVIFKAEIIAKKHVIDDNELIKLFEPITNNKKHKSKKQIKPPWNRL